MRLADFNNQIGKALQDNRLENRVRLETDKNQLIAQLTQFEHQLKAKYPKYAQLSKVQIIGVKQGAKLLPADAVLISYPWKTTDATSHLSKVKSEDHHSDLEKRHFKKGKHSTKN